MQVVSFAGCTFKVVAAVTLASVVAAVATASVVDDNKQNNELSQSFFLRTTSKQKMKESKNHRRILKIEESQITKKIT